VSLRKTIIFEFLKENKNPVAIQIFCLLKTKHKSAKKAL